MTIRMPNPASRERQVSRNRTTSRSHRRTWRSTRSVTWTVRTVARNRATVRIETAIAGYVPAVDEETLSRIANAVTAVSSLTTDAFRRKVPKRLCMRPNSRSMIARTGSAVIEIVSATKSDVVGLRPG